MASRLIDETSTNWKEEFLSVLSWHNVVKESYELFLKYFYRWNSLQMKQQGKRMIANVANPEKLEQDLTKIFQRFLDYRNKWMNQLETAGVDRGKIRLSGILKRLGQGHASVVSYCLSEDIEQDRELLSVNDVEVIRGVMSRSNPQSEVLGGDISNSTPQQYPEYLTCPEAEFLEHAISTLEASLSTVSPKSPETRLSGQKWKETKEQTESSASPEELEDSGGRHMDWTHKQDLESESKDCTPDTYGHLGTIGLEEFVENGPQGSKQSSSAPCETELEKYELNVTSYQKCESDFVRKSNNFEDMTAENDIEKQCHIDPEFPVEIRDDEDDTVKSTVGNDFRDNFSKERLPSMVEACEETEDLSPQSEGQPLRPYDCLMHEIIAVLDSKVSVYDEARVWLLEKVPQMTSLEELKRCIDLTKRQCDELAKASDDPFSGYLEAIRSELSGEQTSETVRTTSQMISDENSDLEKCYQMQDSQKVGNVSPKWEDKEESDLIIDSNFLIIPLIQFSAEKQEEFSVDKFYLSEEGVEELCNLVSDEGSGEAHLYFRSPTRGVVIDFESLDSISANIIGLFGPNSSVVQTMERILGLTSLEIMKENLIILKEGLYLVRFPSDQRHQFIIFNSRNDKDFESVQIDSKAVHFLRYMSQLTKNVVMCLDQKIQDRLQRGTLSGTSEKIKRRFRLNLPDSETALATNLTGQELGYKILPEYDGSWKLFSSQNGLLLAMLNEFEATSTFKETKTGTVAQLKSDVENLPIGDMMTVCELFKEEFLRHFHPTTLRAIHENVTERIQRNCSKIEKDSHHIILNSLTLYFIQLQQPEDFKILAQFFSSSQSENNKNIWNKRIKFGNDKIKLVLSDEDISEILKKLNRQHEHLHAVDKYLHWRFLEEFRSVKMSMTNSMLLKKLILNKRVMKLNHSSTFYSIMFGRLSKLSAEVKSSLNFINIIG